jgi:hypothetical protein
MADFARLVCFDCRIVLSLGNFWQADGPEERRLVDFDGRPSSASAGLNRALWRWLAQHVYHEVRLVGEQSPDAERIDPYAFEPIQGDEAVAEYLEGWDD